jgi:hypothetical protein
MESLFDHVYDAPLNDLRWVLIGILIVAAPLLVTAAVVFFGKVVSLCVFLGRCEWRIRWRPMQTGQRICPRCRYELHDSHASRCSECGSNFSKTGVHVTRSRTYRVRQDAIWCVFLLLLSFILINTRILPNLVSYRELAVTGPSDHAEEELTIRVRQTLFIRDSFAHGEGVCAYVEVLGMAEDPASVARVFFSPPSTDELRTMFERAGIGMDTEQERHVESLCRFMGDETGFAGAGEHIRSARGTWDWIDRGSYRVWRHRCDYVSLQPAIGFLTALVITLIAAGVFHRWGRRRGWNGLVLHGTEWMFKSWEGGRSAR